MSKLASNKPFGETIADEMKIGDLVSWSEWTIEDNCIQEVVFFGTIIEKKSIPQGNREVSVVFVACSKTGSIISLSPFQIRVEETI